MRRYLARAVVALAATATPAAALGPVAFGPDLSASGWETMTFRGRSPAEFSAETSVTLDIRSEQGVSLLWRALPRDFSAGRQASWRWRVDQGVPPTDLARRGGDDRAIAVYFLFGDDAGVLDSPPTSLRAAMRRGRALVYVWGGDAASGSVVASPQMAGRGQMLVLRPASSPTGSWQSESVDLRADFRRVFGREAGPLVGVAVSTDSDDSRTVTEARLTDLAIR